MQKLEFKYQVPNHTDLYTHALNFALVELENHTQMEIMPEFLFELRYEDEFRSPTFILTTNTAVITLRPEF